MAYQALYRKYRPQTFSGVVGQDAIVRTLKNQLQTGRVSHAYLFCGTRGTGKTSTAKILAKAINCLDPQDGEPCGTCALCKAISEGWSLNVIEIDAASNNSVDDIRDLTEEVKYPPAEGKYKVYIIDEVHMLTTSAFNALLKTLEEPPAHVVFILATTDPQKVPPTILSRCQRFDFRRITVAEMAQTLGGYAEREGISAAEDALRYMARLAEGSLRDGLSILDQCAAFYSGEEITLDKVEEIVGAVDDGIYFDMIRALTERDGATAMSLVADSFAAGRDVGQFVTELILRLRNLLVANTLEHPEEVLDLSQEGITEMLRRAGQVSREELLYFISAFSSLSGELKYARNQRILLEVELLRLCTRQKDADSYEALAARLSTLERELAQGVKTVVAQQQTPAPETAAVPKQKPKPKAAKGDQKAIEAAWQQVLKDLPVSTRAVLSQAKPGFWEGDALYLICENAGVEGILKKRLEEIRDRLAEAVGRSVTLRTMTRQAYEETYASEGEDSGVEDTLLHNLLPDAEIE